ncbi:MAG TPA: GNAT family N-acetyltransferase [Kofleriaceae bacterium]|nr:GNAT family N-acetyltransferase [Kofleriaceae bacterium]
MDVRVATPADIDVIVGLVNAAFMVERPFIEGDRTSAAEIGRMMERGAFLVLEEDGAGLASVYVEVRGERGYFGMLAVDPTQQGRKLGRRMVEAAESHLRAAGCGAVDIRIVSARAELPGFYGRLGYVDAGTSDYPADGGALVPLCFLLMTKPL